MSGSGQTGVGVARFNGGMSPRLARPYFGWYVVFAAFCVALFGWGFGFYGLAVYLVELRALRGWSAGLIGSAATLYYLAGALLLAFYDSALARVGQRGTLLIGVAAMAAGVSSLPFVDTPWQLVGAYLVMAVGWSAMSLTAVTALVAPWFDRDRGLAMSLALNGASCGGIVLAPGMMWLTSEYGFGAAVGVCVMLMLAVLVPVAFLVVGRMPREPAGRGEPAPPPALRRPAGANPTRRELLGSGAFWTVAAPFALGLMAQVGFITHQVAFLEPQLGAAGAGLALALTTIAAVAGRVALGAVIDRLEPRATTAACLVSQAAALLAMTWTDSASALYTASVVFGLSVGNLITLPALIVQREFPAAVFVVTVALIAATCQVVYAFGPALLGLLRDAAGDYGPALALCVVLELTAAAGLYAGGRAPYIRGT